MTTMTSNQGVVMMSSARRASKVQVNWSRIGFLSLNVMVWAGLIATARVVV